MDGWSLLILLLLLLFCPVSTRCSMLCNVYGQIVSHFCRYTVLCGSRSQAALSYLRAQERDHVGPGLFSWSNVSIQGYIQFVNQLIPRVDVDLDSLDDEEQMMQEKERRNLEDVFLEKRRSVSSIKIRTLLKVRGLAALTLKRQVGSRFPFKPRRLLMMLVTDLFIGFGWSDGLLLLLTQQENKLEIFEEDMKAFTRSLDSALLPKPRLLQVKATAHHRLFQPYLQTSNNVHMLPFLRFFVRVCEKSVNNSVNLFRLMSLSSKYHFSIALLRTIVF